MIIAQERTLIPACDVKQQKFAEILRWTGNIPKIEAYKVGASLGLQETLKQVVDMIDCATGKKVIYDHQKAGTDIHEETPEQFMDTMAEAGIHAVILFPQSGPVAQYEWIHAAQERKLGVIVGGEMTHPRFLEGDFSQGKKKNYTDIFHALGIQHDITGYMRDTAPDEIYELAARMGVTDFVVPGNKPERVQYYKSLVERCGVKEPIFYSPGLIAQGGSITEAAQVAGNRWHAIVGRALYGASDMRQAVLELTSQL